MYACTSLLRITLAMALHDPEVVKMLKETDVGKKAFEAIKLSSEAICLKMPKVKQDDVINGMAFAFTQGYQAKHADYVKTLTENKKAYDDSVPVFEIHSMMERFYDDALYNANYGNPPCGFSIRNILVDAYQRGATEIAIPADKERKRNQEALDKLIEAHEEDRSKSNLKRSRAV